MPDLLKGVAVVLMIQVHLTELFANIEFFGSVPGRISLFLGGFPAAPMFMIIMGWFSFATRPLLVEMRRALKLLVVGLLLNAALNANLFFSMASGELQVDGWAYLFGVDILFLAAFSLAIGSILKRIFRSRWWLLLLSALLVAAFTPLLSSDVPADGVWRYVRPLLADGYAWWSYFPLFPWLSYVLVGMAASGLSRQQPGWWTMLRSIPAKTAIFIVFFAGSGYGWHMSTNLEAYYHHGLLFFLWAVVAVVASVYFWDYVARQFPDVNRLTWVGRNVTAIYVIQWILIGNLGTWLYRTQSGAALIIWFMLICFITFAAVYYLQRLKQQDSDLV